MILASAAPVSGYVKSVFNDIHWANKVFQPKLKSHMKCREIEPQIKSIHLISDLPNKFQKETLVSLLTENKYVSWRDRREGKKGQHILDPREAFACLAYRIPAERVQSSFTFGDQLSLASSLIR